MLYLILVKPLSYCNKLLVTPKQARLKLQAANGTCISMHGERVMSLSIGLRREFTWTFTIANVETLILGADFLAHSDLSVELSSCTLTDMRTTSWSIIQTFHNLSVLIPSANGCEDLLRQYKSLLSPFTHANPVKHNTTHAIKTSVTPVHTSPRRLHPTKLRVTKDKFENMLKQGIMTIF